jgi:hypothetical protein
LRRRLRRRFLVWSVPCCAPGRQKRPCPATRRTPDGPGRLGVGRGWGVPSYWTARVTGCDVSRSGCCCWTG